MVVLPGHNTNVFDQPQVFQVFANDAEDDRRAAEVATVVFQPDGLLGNTPDRVEGWTDDALAAVLLHRASARLIYLTENKKIQPSAQEIALALQSQQAAYALLTTLEQIIKTTDVKAHNTARYGHVED